MLNGQDAATARSREPSAAVPVGGCTQPRFNGLSGECLRTLQACGRRRRARTSFLCHVDQGHSETVLGLDLSLGEVLAPTGPTVL